MINLYEFLNVKQNADTPEIQSAINLAEEGGKDDKLILACKNILLNESRRTQYNKANGYKNPNAKTLKIKSNKETAKKTSSTMTVIYIVVGIAALLVLSGIYSGYSKRSAELKSTSSGTSYSNQSNTVTYSQFNQIQPNITTSAELSGIMGSQGKVISEGDGVLMLMWQNNDGSNMNVLIQNGVVINKAQAGLK